jgi:sugar phosphate isomerase/epimerase
VAPVAGLCSVTLRHLGIDDVARVAARAGLVAVEWGGDVHVPPGDAAAVARARAAAAAAGVEVLSYGSYLVAGADLDRDAAARACDTAAALGATTIRVWCPWGIPPAAGPDTADPAVVAALVRVTDEAARRGMIVGMEFHGGTPTATAAGARALLEAAGHPALRSYWQPPYWDPARAGVGDPRADVADLELLGVRLAHLHVYEWGPDSQRRALQDGGNRWPAVLAAAAALPPPPGGPRAALLEFVAGDDPEQVVADAMVLRGWLAGAAQAADAPGRAGR